MKHRQNQNSLNNIERTFRAQDLMRFRERLEAETAAPIAALEVNAVLLLAALSEFLGLGWAQRSQILGPHGARYLAANMAAPVHQTTDQPLPCTDEY
jgi:hypothetical protein